MDEITYIVFVGLAIPVIGIFLLFFVSHKSQKEKKQKLKVVSDVTRWITLLILALITGFFVYTLRNNLTLIT